MQPAQQYDRGSTVFSPDGRLFQVEYAREAVKRGTTAVGLTHDAGVALIVTKRFNSPLIEPESIGKIFALADHVGCASSGLVADSRVLVDHGRLAGQMDEITYDETIPIPTLVDRISDLMQTYTQYGGVRPFGTSLLVGGVDDEGPHLIQADPSGASVAYDATSIGQGRDAVVEILEAEYEPGLSQDQAIGLGIQALRQVTESGLTSDNLDVGTVTAEDRFRTLEPSEIEAYLGETQGEEE